MLSEFWAVSSGLALTLSPPVPSLSVLVSVWVVTGSAFVVNVVPKGPAQSAGIRTGDVIVSFNGKPVNSSDDLANAIQAKKAGDTITVGLLRAVGNGDYEKKTVRVTLASRPNSLPGASNPEG